MAGGERRNPDRRVVYDRTYERSRARRLEYLDSGVPLYFDPPEQRVLIPLPLAGELGP